MRQERSWKIYFQNASYIIICDTITCAISNLLADLNKNKYTNFYTESSILKIEQCDMIHIIE